MRRVRAIGGGPRAPGGTRRGLLDRGGRRCEGWAGSDPHFAEPRLARLYDAFDADRSDLDHYVRWADELGGRRVLDIGCGTGVLALLLADRGVSVIGLDLAAASLDVARGRPGADRVTWVEGDAGSLPVTEDVGVALMTGNVAQVFLEDQEWSAVLRRTAAVLRAGGHLVFETRDPARRAWEEWTPARTHQRIEDAVEGVVESWQQVMEVDLPFVVFENRFRFADGEELVSVSRLRFRTREEVAQSLADAWLDPRRARAAYLRHLLDRVVAPAGRLIVGVHDLPRDDPLLQDLEGCGHRVAGVSRRAHPSPGLDYTATWIDAPGRPRFR